MRRIIATVLLATTAAFTAATLTAGPALADQAGGLIGCCRD